VLFQPGAGRQSRNLAFIFRKLWRPSKIPDFPTLNLFLIAGESLFRKAWKSKGKCGGSIYQSPLITFFGGDDDGIEAALECRRSCFCKKSE
jgi:hypothetical protein